MFRDSVFAKCANDKLNQYLTRDMHDMIPLSITTTHLRIRVNGQNSIFKTLPFRRTWRIDVVSLTAQLCILWDFRIHDTESNYSLLVADMRLACMALVRGKFIDQSVATVSAYIFGRVERQQPITRRALNQTENESTI